MGFFGLFEMTCEETKSEYIFRNVPTRAVATACSKLWSSKIQRKMFTGSAGNWISIRKFFALDLYYMLEKMLDPEFNYGKILPGVRYNQAEIEEFKELVFSSTWLKNINETFPARLDLKKLSNLTMKPLDFQMEFLERYSDNVSKLGLKGFLLNGAPGSGKTFTSLALAECASADTIIVICPKNALRRVWEDNINRVFKTKQTYWLSDEDKPFKDQRILVFHYEALERALGINRFSIGKTVLILDESHNLNEMSSMRTQYFLELVRRLEPAETIFASGTPVKALGAEVVPLFTVIDPLFDEATAARYASIHGKNSKYTNDIINYRIGFTSHVIEKKELGLLAPEMITYGVKFPGSVKYTLDAIAVDMAAYIKERVEYYRERESEHREEFYNILKSYKDKLITESELYEYAEYIDNLNTVIKAYNQGSLFSIPEVMAACNRYEKKIASTLKPTERDRFLELKTVIKYVKLKIQGEVLGRVVGRRRIECHVELAKHIDYREILNTTRKKTVVFSTYTEVIFSAEKTLEKLKYEPLLVYGKTNNNLNSIINRFEQIREINPLIATYASLSTAVPLVMADTVIMIDSPFRAYIQEQAISRVHRLGSDTKVRVYTCILDTGEKLNISSRSVDILRWSQNQVEEILGIKSPFKVEHLESENSEWKEDGNDVMSLESFYSDYHGILNTWSNL